MGAIRVEVEVLGDGAVDAMIGTSFLDGKFDDEGSSRFNPETRYTANARRPTIITLDTGWLPVDLTTATIFFLMRGGPQGQAVVVRGLRAARGDAEIV